MRVMSEGLALKLASIAITVGLSLGGPGEQERVKRDDPDHEEMLRMDERARVREREENLRLPSARESEIRRALRLDGFIKDVDAFASAFDRPKDLRRYAGRLESFLIEGMKSPIPKPSPLAASTKDRKIEMIREAASNLLPLLSELKDLERRNIVDLSKRKQAIAGLRTITMLVK